MPESTDLLKKRFTNYVLKDEAEQLNTFQTQLMQKRGFTSSKFLNNRNFTVTNNQLVYNHPLELRFVDMKTRKTNSGQILKKKNHPVHNKIMFGFISKLIPRLKYEFTEEIKNQMRKADQK